MKVYLSPETKSLKVNGQDLLVSFGVAANSPVTPTAPERMFLPDVTKTNGTW